MFESRVLPLQQRAAVIHGTNDLRVEDRAVPAPGPGEALIRLQAVGICGSDLGYLRGAGKYPVRSSFVLGHEAAGVVVEAVPAVFGPEATSTVAPGTRVAVVPGTSCGRCDQCIQGVDNLCRDVRYLGSAATTPPVDGALQEYLCLPFQQLQPVPDELSDAAAALLEPLAVAEHGVRRADVAGKATLIIGAGTIGQLAALAARAAGATSVTVCEVLGRRRRLAVEHGADKAIAPADVEALVATGATFDAVIEATGSSDAVSMGVRAATPGRGRVVLVGNPPPDSGPAGDAIARSEVWVTATFRFPNGLARALEVATSGGVDIDWLVEQVADFSSIHRALATAMSDDPPLKVQILPSVSLSN